MCRVGGARTRARWRHGFDCAPKQQARLPGVRRSPRPDLQHPWTAGSLLGQLSLALLVGTAAARRQVGSVTTGRSGTGPLTTSAQQADWAHSSLPHLYRDRAHRSHICSGTGLAPSHICSRDRAHPGPHLHRTGCAPAHICTGIGPRWLSSSPSTANAYATGPHTAC